jgi:hypothetical protein
MNGGMVLEMLPRLARVAFAARCVRRVQALLGRFSPDCSEEFLETVDRAVTLAERSGAEGRPCKGLAEAAEEAERRARGAVGATRECAAETGLAAVSLSAPLRRAVAYAAAAAAFAALEPSARAAARAAAYTQEAVRAADAGYVESAMASDLERLQEAAGREGWNDERPVAPEFFEPL